MAAFSDEPELLDEAALPAPTRSARQVYRWMLAGAAILLVVGWFAPELMSWKLTIFIGIALLAFAGWLVRQEHLWLKSARVIPGTVVELLRVSGPKGRSSYRPRIRYTTADGSVHDLIRTADPIPLAVGEPLAVAFHESSPQDLRVLTFRLRYGYAACVAVLGIGLILLGGIFLVGRAYVPSIYLSPQTSAAKTNAGR